MIAAASDSLWNGGAACGTTYTITCVGGTNDTPNPCNGGASISVKIVDRCPSPGCQATLDLSQEAFAAIGNLDAGKILINYNQYARATRALHHIFFPCSVFTRGCFLFNFFLTHQ